MACFRSAVLQGSAQRFTHHCLGGPQTPVCCLSPECLSEELFSLLASHCVFLELEFIPGEKVTPNTGLTSLGFVHPLDPSLVIYHYFVNSLVPLIRFKEVFWLTFLVALKGRISLNY